MKKESRFKIKPFVLFFYMCLVGMALYIIIGIKLRPTDYENPNPAKVYESDFDWKYIDRDGNWKRADMPFYPMRRPGELSVIKATLPNNIRDNMVLTLRPDQLDMYVEIDGIKRAYYSTQSTRFMGTVSCRRYIFMPVFETDCGKDIEVRLTTTSENMGRFETQLYGPKSEVLAEMVQDNIWDIIIAAIMLIVSAFCLIIGIVLKIGFKTEVEIIYMAIMSILASVWILCNAEISQVYFTNGSIFNNVDYMCLLLLPMPFIIYVDTVQGKRFNRIFKIFEAVIFVEIVVCMALAIRNVYDLSQMYMVVTVSLGLSLISILVTIYIDVFKYKNYSYISIAIGIAVAVVASIIQIAMYIGGFYKFGGNAVGIALLVMLGAAILDTFQKVKKIMLEKQVAVAERAAESNFLASMSHEIRTPINAVLGMNEMIVRESKDPVITEYAANIERSGNMLLSIVNDILDFSKVNSGKMDIVKTDYSLKELVDDIAQMVLPRAVAKNLDFRVDMAPTTINDLNGDEVRIKQVIVNLLTNAIKYTDEGHVILKVVTQVINPDNVNLNVSVIDTGRGINIEDQDKLFDAFSRVDQKRNRNIEGTGLGLALVKQLTTNMGGNVGVESTYGKGSTFYISLPQQKKSERTVEEVKIINSKSEASYKKDENVFTAPDAHVLVVDDMPMNLTVMKGLLKRTQVKLDTAGSGEKAIELVKQNKYDLILMDHLMPGMDGEETLAVIRSEKLAEDTPIVVLTANVFAGVEEHYLEVGFSAYMSKPVKTPELEAMLKKYL